ncbi:MAG: alpha-2-macroglobulin family protein [Candidatus Altarchaeum sp.]|nr:alpha-2-macroglobulin family protein [Candidatus Altarchaeum sp.]
MNQDKNNRRIEIEDKGKKIIVMPLDDNSREISQVLANDTARKILSLLSEKSMTLTEICTEMEISLSTGEYSLKKLQDTGLIKIIGTKQSERNVEMKIYAPEEKFIVIAPKSMKKEDTISALKSLLPLLAIGIIILGFGIYMINQSQMPDQMYLEQLGQVGEKGTEFETKFETDGMQIEDVTKKFSSITEEKQKLPEVKKTLLNPSSQCNVVQFKNLDDAEKILKNLKDGKYLVFLPKILFKGSEGSASISSVSNITQCIKVSIVSENEKIELFDTSINKQSSVSFEIPELKSGNYKIIAEPYIKYSVEDEKSSYFEGVVTMTSALKGNVKIEDAKALFIETDKPIYKPSQTIHLRILTLNNLLKPISDNISIEVKDAKGIKILKKTITTNMYGVGWTDVPLAHEINLGTWKITAKSNKSEASIDVGVEKYVLPKFEIDLNTHKNWFLVNEKIYGTANANYFFGKDVEGNLTIDAYRYVGYWEKFATIKKDIKGKSDFEIPAVRYVAGTYSAGGEGSVMINISIIDGSNHTEETSKLLKIVENKVILQVIPDSKVIKPGLPFQLLIVTEDPDGKPLDEDVQLNIEFKNKLFESFIIQKKVETKNGIAFIQLNAPKDTIGAIIESAIPKKYISKHLELQGAYSQSSNFIHITQTSENKNVGEKIKFKIYSTGNSTVYYNVVSKGITLFSGMTNIKEISFILSSQMVPDSKIFAYQINQNNEISIDTLPFSVGLNSNNLNASFEKNETTSGSNVQIKFKTNEQAMIGLSIVDESVYALAEGRLNLKQVFDELEKRFMEPQIEIHPNEKFMDEDDYWDSDRDYDYHKKKYVYKTKGSKEIVDENGFVVLTNNIKVPEGKKEEIVKIISKEKKFRPEYWSGDGMGVGSIGDFTIIILNMTDPFLLPSPPDTKSSAKVKINEVAKVGSIEGGELAEVKKVRTFFPETWIWVPNLLTNENGNATLNLTVPDSITTWRLHAVSTSSDGIGISEDKLTVFQDLFVDIDAPYEVTRNDEFLVKVQIYNYLNESLNVFVEVKKADWFALLDEDTKNITIKGNSVNFVTFTIKPENVGIQEIEITAKSKNRADAIRKEIIVEYEGIRNEDVENSIINDRERKSIHVDFPDNAINGSERIYLSITPSIIAQQIDGLEDLLAMPYGCGEQNMIFFAPDVEILRYLKASNQLTPKISAKSEYFINTGYQRELTFQHKDGSFSAFGENDASGSLWLTDFVVLTFSGARDIKEVDNDVLRRAVEWIENHQNDDGSWQNMGFVIHQDMIGEIKGKYSITAYTTLALLEYGNTNPQVLQKSVNYLEKNLDNIKNDSYNLALATQVLKKINSNKAERAKERLLELAKNDENGIYWENIETTSYSVLTLMEFDDANSRNAAKEGIKYLISKKNSMGGYTNTQDTVVALKALTKAAYIQNKNCDVEILIKTKNKTSMMKIDKENFDVLQMMEIKDRNFEITAKGNGSVYYQIVKRYNVFPKIKREKKNISIEVNYNAKEIKINDEIEIEVKVKYDGLPDSTGMAIIDVGIPSGFTQIDETFENLKNKGIIKRYEIAGRKVIFYVDNIKKREELQFKFKILAKFPVKALIPSSKIYAYYKPEIMDETIDLEKIVVK